MIACIQAASPNSVTGRQLEVLVHTAVFQMANQLVRYVFQQAADRIGAASRARYSARDGAVFLKQNLDSKVELERFGPPCDPKQSKNYLGRTQWQYYQSRTPSGPIEQLIRFAQHDRGYLRAVAWTSRKQADPGLENQNLPMTLSFRGALRATGERKAAVGLLDESICMPFFRVRSILRAKLPVRSHWRFSLCRATRKGGADKSRHSDVFGGIYPTRRRGNRWVWL